MGKKRSLATAVMAVGAAAGAHAAAVTVSQTVQLGALLQGESQTLQFDFGAALAAQGLDATQALSGHLVVYGMSDGSFGAGVAQDYGAYEQTGSRDYFTYVVTGYAFGGCSYSSWGGGRCYYYPVYAPVASTDRDFGRSRDILHQDSVADALRVSAGGSSTEASVGLSAVQDPYGAWVYETMESRYPGGYDRYYNRERNAYEGHFGEFEALLGLDAQALADFRMDALLDVGFLGTLGRFSDLTVTLNVQIDDGPATGHNVPEPGTLALVAAGLAGAAAVRRRQRGAKATA